MRIALIALRLLFVLPYVLFRIWRYGQYEDKFAHHAEAFAIIKKTAIKANRAGRIRLETFGTENVPDEDGFIMYCNHQGLYDIVAFFQTCPKPFSFLAKYDVRNIIVLKQVIAALGAYHINSKDMREQMKVINSVAADVKRGKNFLIFPEGTRSGIPNKMVDFKPGSFKSATKAKCPIVPCAVIDTYKPFDDKSIKPAYVKLIYLPPIYYEDYKEMNSVEIADLVKSRIEVAIKEKLRN